MSKSRFSQAVEEASSKGKDRHVQNDKESGSRKVFSYTLEESVGESVKEAAKKTPFSASSLLNSFIKEELDEYIRKYLPGKL